MENQTAYVARPVEKQPKRKFYLYRRRACFECGFIHLYRKVAEEKNPVRYRYIKHDQARLFDEEVR